MKNSRSPLNPSARLLKTVACGLFLSFLPFLSFAAEKPGPPRKVDGGAIQRAMRSELKRSMDSLRMGRSPGPYFLSYLYWQMDSYGTTASLGNLEETGEERQGYLDVDLRVGDYGRDNSHFEGSLVFGPPLRSPLPRNGDTLLLRRALWAATDAEYKVALEQLAQKRSYLAAHPARRTLPDFTRQAVGTASYADPEGGLDTARWRARVQKLSATLRPLSWLRESRAAFRHYRTTLYYVDSEGSAYTYSWAENTLLVALLAQAEDGMPVWDYLRISRREMPGGGKTEADAAFAGADPLLLDRVRRLDRLRREGAASDYRGPVLFQESAAGDLLQAALIAPQASLRPRIGLDAEAPFLLGLRGKRYFPPGFAVVDDPGIRAEEGRFLQGYYPFDHEGQPARRVTLLADGLITDFYRGKRPFEEVRVGSAVSIPPSNGHFRYGQGFPGVVKLSVPKPLAAKKLRRRLCDLAEDEGLQSALVLSRNQDDDAFALLRHPLKTHLSQGQDAASRGGFTLPPAVAVDALDCRRGDLTPVRGLSLAAIDSKSLRDIVAAGDAPFIHEPQAASSFIVPPLLFSLLDLNATSSRFPRPPLLP